MTLTWSDWQKPTPGQPNSPHVLWHAMTHAPRAEAGRAGSMVELDVAALIAEFGHYAPVRQAADNPAFWKSLPAPAQPWAMPSGLNAPDLAPDTVLVAVIDRGIAPHHHRLRKADGGTRVVAAWQQDADWGIRKQTYLPHGREIYKDEIDTAIAAAPYDPEGALRALGLHEMGAPSAPRSLAARQSHGAAVTDLCAGAAPGAADRLAVIAIGLPDRAGIGASGAFLDYFCALGLARVVALGNWLWDQNAPRWAAAGTPPAKGRKGFPIVVNLSFGKNAGARDGGEFLARTASALQKSRPRGGPLQIVMPAGNDNLEQGHGVLTVPAGGGAKTLTWWVPSDDQSINALELWAEVPVSLAHAPRVSVTLPDGTALPASAPVPGAMRVLSDAAGVPRAALFARMHPVAGQAHKQALHYVLCTQATLDHDHPARVAPAGTWTIGVQNPGPQDVAVRAMVQTDKGLQPQGSASRRSVLRDPSYQDYDAMGRVIDSHVFPFSQPVTSLDRADFVRRRGSLNASASAPGLVTVAGHRVSDARPAVYSSAAEDDAAPWQMPDASLPVDAGFAHRGVLASGSVDGSVIPVSGTSFAAAFATRRIADEIARRLASGEGVDGFDPSAYFAQQAAIEDPFTTQHPVPSAKLGAGRLHWSEPDRQGRRFAR